MHHRRHILSYNANTYKEEASTMYVIYLVHLYV